MSACANAHSIAQDMARERKISDKESLNKGHLSIKDTRFCPCYNILARRRREGIKGGRETYTEVGRG